MEFRTIFRKGLFSLAVGLACWLSDTPPAVAEWHGSLTFLSDYIYRGYSKNQGNPLAQAHLDYQHETGWFAGLGLSQVRFDDQTNSNRAEIEIKPYFGWNWPIDRDWRAELSVSGYLFDNKLFNHSADYAEYSASLHFRDWLSATVSVAQNAYQRQADVPDYELNYRRDIWDTVQFSAGLGYHQAGKLLGQDYFYWNAGLSWFVSEHVSIDMRYLDTALTAHHHADPYQDEFYPRPQDDRYLFSVTVGF